MKVLVNSEKSSAILQQPKYTRTRLVAFQKRNSYVLSDIKILDRIEKGNKQKISTRKHHQSSYINNSHPGMEEWMTVLTSTQKQTSATWKL